MITEKQFCKIMKKIEKNEKFLSKMNDVFDEFSKDVQIIETGLEDTLIEVLQLHFEDSSDLIGYWCWELWFGEKYTDGCVIDENGNNVKLKTAEDLYKVLTDKHTVKITMEYEL